MALRVAVQMDPLASINIAGDSTFALMLSAQARGHRLWHYAAEDLTWEAGRLSTYATPVSVRRPASGSGESHFTVVIESAAFAGQTRLQRQRAVIAALGDIPGQRVHALAIRARAPGE